MKQMPSAQEASQNWVRGMSNATDKIRKGAQRVTESPGAKAAAAVDLWQQNVSSARAREKYVANVGAMSTEQWRTALMDKGIPRIAAGATAAQSKMQAFQQDFFPFLQGVVNSLPPRGDLEQNLARANALARGLSGYRRGGRR